MSVSERQELAIARAVFRDARLLVLDEPTVALDAEQSQHLFSLVENLTHQGVSVFYVSHYREEIFALADRITALRDGRLVKTERRRGRRYHRRPPSTRSTSPAPTRSPTSRSTRSSC
ncbi:MAG: hypothetical protein ACLPZR_21370 [Solirubrobacteraceae bacterium]